MSSETSFPSAVMTAHAMVRARDSLTAARSRLGKAFDPCLLLFAFAAVLVIGRLDLINGDMSLSVVYFIPIAICTWLSGRLLGLLVAVASTFVALWADLLVRAQSLQARLAAEQAYVPFWNAGMMLCLFAFVVWVLWELKQFQFNLAAKVENRTAQLAQANADLQAAQVRLVEAAKLETVGLLAAGVAHEVKNPLMTITMAVDFFAQGTPKNDLVGTTMVSDMREAVGRANRVISELLELSRPGGLKLKSEPLHAVLDEALQLVKRPLVQKNISVDQQLEGPIDVCLDKNKATQVLLNLLMNAIHAMSEGGRLVIATQVRRSDDGRPLGVSIEIVDNGGGIRPAHLAKLFEPFFTTKPAGQGTGLGLLVSRQIVRQHGGELTLENRPDGLGARARLHFLPHLPAT